VRVATWNIQHGRRSDDGRVDPDAVAAACAALSVDVLALQEVERFTRRVGGTDVLTLVAAATGLTAIDGLVVQVDGGTYGNALLVRPDLLDDPVGPKRLYRPWVLPWRRPEPRGAVVARLRGVPGVVVSGHLGLRKGERRHQLPSLLSAAAGSMTGVVLGDLNAFAPEVAPVARRHGWSLVDVPPAFPADAPRHVIDHVLVKGVRARPTPDAGRPVVSDHRPVVVEIDEEVSPT
jgi:endonuclease/exonuclease/phosphatase family metal-dependent hydrolase